MATGKCRACGAELRLRPARCPLCGTDQSSREHDGATPIEDYQSTVRQLRDELKRMRRQDVEVV